jgi:signal transduction histidine kinase
MKISQRLYLTVTPAILGVFLIAALAYWGEYARRAPSVVLFVGALAVIASLALTWSNARYVAHRIERLAAGAAASRPQASTSAMSTGANGAAPATDEIDEIERAVDRLSSAVESAEASQADRERAFEQRAHDYARLLASVADSAAKRLEEVRLPLHILLDNHFGELNENQEEMLGAARTAAEAADADMVSLGQIAELDLGSRQFRQDRVKPSDLIDSIRPMLMAAAEAAGATLELEAEPLLPAIVGDRSRLQDALVTLLRGGIEPAAADSRLHVQVDRHGGAVRFILTGGAEGPMSVRSAAAARVIQAHGGKVERRGDGVTVSLPLSASQSGVSRPQEG